jgi:histone-binding protein RBBP4
MSTSTNNDNTSRKRRRALPPTPPVPSSTTANTTSRGSNNTNATTTSGRTSPIITTLSSNSTLILPSSNTGTNNTTTTTTTATTTTNSLNKLFPPVDPDDRIAALRKNSVLLYDAILNHAMQWGSLSLAWGPVIENQTNRTLVGVNKGENYLEEFNDEHTLYFSGRTDGTLEGDTWIGQPAELFVARVAIPKPRTTRRLALRFQETNKSNRVQILKRIIHPGGEINRVRALTTSPHIIVTHTDSETVYLWDTKLQPHRPLPEDLSHPGRKKRPEPYKCNIPDATLVGHTDGLKYALETFHNRIVSGSNNGTVLCWDVGNNIVDKTVSPRAMFKNGHTDSVEDCCFSPVDDNIIMSVSLDRSLLIWDARTEREPVSRVNNAHGDDINCCSWSHADSNMLLTGGSDCMANIYDLRKILNSDASVATVYRVPHSASLVNVRCSPHNPYFFLTADENSWVTLFSTNINAGAAPPTGTVIGDGPRIIFQHVGHRSPAVDLGWNMSSTCPEDVVIASVSDDSQDEAKGGGGTLQIWRVSEFATKNARVDPKWLREFEDALLPVRSGGNSGTTNTTMGSIGGGGGGGSASGSVSGGGGNRDDDSESDGGGGND